MTKKKKNLPKILINFMKMHKKKIFQMKNQYMTQKKKNLSNTHKLHKNSKTYPDANLTCSLLRPGSHWGNAIQIFGVYEF